MNDSARHLHRLPGMVAALWQTPEPGPLEYCRENECYERPTHLVAVAEFREWVPVCWTHANEDGDDLVMYVGRDEGA